MSTTGNQTNFELETNKLVRTHYLECFNGFANCHVGEQGSILQRCFTRIIVYTGLVRIKNKTSLFNFSLKAGYEVHTRYFFLREIFPSANEVILKKTVSKNLNNTRDDLGLFNQN